MTRTHLFAAGFALVSLTSMAQEPVDAASCRAATGDESAIAVSHEGTTYYVTSPACREAFLAEPARFAQLFDALAELEAAGKAPPPRHDPESLVPS